MNKNYILLFFIISSVLFSCSSDVGNFQIGEDLVDTKSSILITDTFSLKLSTVVLDSIPTSGTSQLLCGKYANGVSGSTEVLSYFNFDLTELQSSITDDDILDSITIELGYSGYYIGDTTQLMNIDLFRLSEQLEFIETETSDNYLYNNSSFPYDEVPLGSVSFLPHVSADSIEFRINNELGQELLNLILLDGPQVESNETFNDYLRGFVLRANSDSKAILGFNGDTSGVKINLYTHLIDVEKVEKKYTFYLAAEGTHFNQAISDRSGTGFASLAIQKEEVPATSSNNKTVIAGSAGLLSRIDFPSLNEIFSYDDRVMIKAELILIPARENELRFIPSALNFYESDNRNRLGDQLTVTSSSQEVPVEASLIADYQYPENSYYYADITQYLLDELAGNYYNPERGLLVSVPTSDLQTKADLVILNGENASQYLPKLKLYFLIYE